ncbi:hypothetical protein DKG77_06930 [Flagellimonas aquimarina]|uniref:DUF4382 domain-containing protein n=2 Tax=Flagellimonas aquimarina TaxID=2201895 RepID=A0A316LD72_9FLAO|nr:hypothetical protein DKG77_06930 [Allomuricauda koreensis]
MNIKQKFMKNYKIYILFALAGIFVTSCSEDDKVTIDVQNTVTSGAVLRTIAQTGTAWDVLDDTEAYSVEVEVQDAEDGALLSEVRVYVDLVDNTEAVITDPAETLIATLPASAFSTGANGFPRSTYNTTLSEIASTLGLSLGDYNCGDQFNVRMELALTDGRMFTDTDATGNVSGGSFFSSPYAYRISLIAPLPNDDLYTGQYQLTTVTNGIYGVADYADGVYTLESVNNTTKVIKDVTTFVAFGGFGPVDVEFELVCGEIIMKPAQGVGAGCNATIQSGPANVNATYDLMNPDDSDFLLNFTSDETADCTNSVQAAVRLTKV